MGTCQTPETLQPFTHLQFKHWIVNTNLGSSLLDKVESCSRGKSYSPACKASLVVGFHTQASTNRTWNWSRTTFWTFCYRQSTRTELAFHGHHLIWLLHKLPRSLAGQPLLASISFVKTAHRNYDYSSTKIVANKRELVKINVRRA